jgi:acetyltransferase-like isoleucine patch superfamily enzyme
MAKVNRFCKIQKSSIDKYSYIGPSSKIYQTDISKYCSISWDCDVGLENHQHALLSTSPLFTETTNGTGSSWTSNQSSPPKNRTRIGNDVWIGARTLIIGGIEVGDGAVIGAGSIVTRSIPPYAIAVGSPARVIKYRFPSEIIRQLLEIKWWDYPEEYLRDNISLFQTPILDINKLAQLVINTSE